MAVKRRIPNRPRAPRRTELKLGNRVLRAGDIVKISGVRGDFKITRFSDDGTEVTVRGGTPGGAILDRTFFVERIGTRKALAGTEKAAAKDPLRTTEGGED